MRTIFVDPVIGDLDKLSRAVVLIRRQGPSDVVCFFNTHQQSYFRSNGIEVINYSSLEWPIRERNRLMEEIHQAFNDQVLKPWSNISIVTKRKTYVLNVLRFISGNRFLKDVFLPVAKTLELYFRDRNPDKVLILGGSEFKDHLTFALMERHRQVQMRFIPLRQGIRPWNFLKRYVFAFLSFGMLGLWISKTRFRREKMIIISSGSITAPIIKMMGDRVGMINSIGHPTHLFRLVGFWYDFDVQVACSQIKVVLEKEKHDKDDSTRLAFDIFVHYLMGGVLASKLKDAFACLAVLDLIRPSAIVQYNLIGEHYPLLMWCAANEIPSICVQHGIQGKFGYEVKHDIESKYYYAWADLPIDKLRNSNVIVKTYGNPALTVASLRGQPIFRTVRKILVAPTGLPFYKADVDADFWDEMISFFRITDFDVKVRFHHKDLFKAMVIRNFTNSGIAFSIATGSIYEAILESDLVITTVSTVALDAFGLDRHVVIINNAYESEFFSRFDAAVVLQSSAGLKNEIDRLSNDAEYFFERITKQRKFFDLFFERSAGSKIAEEIVQLALK